MGRQQKQNESGNLPIYYINQCFRELEQKIRSGILIPLYLLFPLRVLQIKKNMNLKTSLFTTICFLVMLLPMGCKQQQQEEVAKDYRVQDSIDFSFQTVLKHAKGFKVINHEAYKEIYVFHPITTDTLGKYITTLKGTILPDSIKIKGKVIEVPAANIACLSTTEVGSVEELDLREKLIGSGSPEYIWDKEIQKRIQEGKVKEIGRGMGFNLEKIVALAPELLMQNYMDKTDVDGNLSRIGVTVLYNNAWKEHSLLGRAEWIKFMALFFCKEQVADSIFKAVESNYKYVKERAARTQTKPTVMYGYDYKGTWYIPQDGSYVAQTIRDAHAVFKGSGPGNSSVPKSFEEVYALFHDAEYWLSTQGKIRTLDEFLSSNDRYPDFQAARNKKVYLNNKREKPTGGNDYWESGINRPDLLLKDVVKILHPELFPEYKTVYWHHLK